MPARGADSAGSVLREGRALSKFACEPARARLADGEHLLFSLNLSPVHFLTCIRSARPDVSQPLHERLEFQGTFGLTNIDRKSTRLNSSHVSISYAVFCLKKKNK